MKTRFDEFLALSASLTGFSRLTLLGTGVAEQYLRTVDEVLPPGFMDTLLAAHRRLPSGEGCGPGLVAQLLEHPELGPVARNLIVLWYCGTWRQLPDAFRAAHGASPLDTTRVVSAAAYLAGLQWTVAGAHPAGGMQQGFASWAMPPEGDER